MARISAETIVSRSVLQLCRAKGWTLVMLATRMGWTRDQVAALEAGTLDVTLDQLDALAALFEVTPFDLLQSRAPQPVRSETMLRYG